jgi:hypothetical protein
MVNLANVNEFHEYIPDLWFNESKEVSVQLKCVSILDFQKAVREQTGVSPEKLSELNHDFIKKHVGKIAGLEVGGVPIDDFDKLRERGPTELYNWISTVIYTTQQLSECEVKN